ncbi:MAG: hypothetical protein RIQ81_307 [Pseudomonadota bacterium]|jgi:hypothetical protein
MSRPPFVSVGLLLLVTLSACKTRPAESGLSDITAVRERLLCKGRWICENPSDNGPIQSIVSFNPARPETRPDPAACERLLGDELKRRKPCANASIVAGSAVGAFESYEVQLVSPGSGLGARLDSIMSATTATIRRGCNGANQCAALTRTQENAARQLDAIAQEMRSSAGISWECSTTSEGNLRKFLSDVCEGDYEGNNCEEWAASRNSLKRNGAAICRLNQLEFCRDFFCE